MQPLLDPSRICRILIVKLTSMGDVVHVTPAIRALRRAFPQAELVMAVDRRFGAVVRHDPALDRVIEAEMRSKRKLAAFLQARRQLHGYTRPRFDLAIDFQGTVRSAAWVYASGARIKAGRPRMLQPEKEWRPGWQRLIRPDMDRHAVEVCAEILAAVGVPCRDLTPQIHLSPCAKTRVADLLAERGLPSKGFLLLNPCAAWPARCWPAERYADLVRRIRPNVKVPVAITTGPGESAAGALICERLEDLSEVHWFDNLPLDELFCLLAEARLVVGGDTGPVHAAAALGVELVGLYGPSWPQRTGPWGHLDAVIQMRRSPDPGAFRRDRQGSYIRAIDVESVHQAVVARLGPPRCR